MKSWMPTRLLTGESCADREETENAPVRSARVVSTACKEGDLSNWGRSGLAGVCASNIIYRVMAGLEDGEGRTTCEAG